MEESTQIKINGNTLNQYTYDSNSQLIRENNGEINKTITYEYDLSGNILNKKVYGYTTSETLGTPLEVINYGYETSNNQLTTYKGQSISYDAIGNPTSYLGKTMTWNGRELTSINNNTYTYSSDGLRRSKTVNYQTTTYDYSGSQIVHEKM